MTIFVIIDLLFNSFISINYRATLTKDYLSSNKGYNDDTLDSINWLKNNDQVGFRPFCFVI